MDFKITKPVGCGKMKRMIFIPIFVITLALSSYSECYNQERLCRAEIRLTSGTKMTGYISWNYQWGKFKKDTIVSAAFFRNNKCSASFLFSFNSFDIHEVKYPKAGTMVAIRAPQGLALDSVVDVRIIPGGMYDNRDANIPIVTMEEVKLLNSPPLAMQNCASDGKEVYYLSYTKAVTEKQLSNFCNMDDQYLNLENVRKAKIVRLVYYYDL